MLVGGRAYVDQRIAFDLESKSILSVPVDADILGERGLLDQPQPRRKEEVVVVRLLQQFTRNGQDAHDVLVLSKAFKQVADVATTRLATAQRGFPRLHAVHATLVGEDEEAIFAEARSNELRRVLGLGCHALQPTSATVLGAEGLNRRVADVIVLAQGDDNGSLLDEVFAVHGQWHGVDEGTALVAVSVHEFSQFVLQNRQSARPRRQHVFEVGDDQLQFLVFVLDLGNIKSAELVKTTFSDGLGLGFTEIKRIDASHGFITTENVLELFSAGT